METQRAVQGSCAKDGCVPYHLYLLSVIEKRFQDAGLRDVIIESGVIAEGSVSGVLEGRTYNRAIRCHKLMFEALNRLALIGFNSGTDEHHKDKKPIVDEFSQRPESTL